MPGNVLGDVIYARTEIFYDLSHHELPFYCISPRPRISLSFLSEDFNYRAAGEMMAEALLPTSNPRLSRFSLR